MHWRHRASNRASDSIVVRAINIASTNIPARKTLVLSSAVHNTCHLAPSHVPYHTSQLSQLYSLLSDVFPAFLYRSTLHPSTGEAHVIDCACQIISWYFQRSSITLQFTTALNLDNLKWLSSYCLEVYARVYTSPYIWRIELHSCNGNGFHSDGMVSIPFIIH